MKKTNSIPAPRRFQIDLRGAQGGTPPTLTRTGARAILFNDKGALLMIRGEKGDYTFPGGPLKKGDTPEGVLKREVLAETGHSLNVGEHVGAVFERRHDYYDPSVTYELVSHYYACTLEGHMRATFDFDAGWVHPLSALKANEETQVKMPWVRRETEVLRKLLE